MKKQRIRLDDPIIFDVTEDIQFEPDTVIPGATPGDDKISGSPEKDLIEGQAGDDTLGGGAQDDFLIGGSGDDRLSDAGGDNILIGGLGSDRLVANRGDDLYIGVDLERGAGRGEIDTFFQVQRFSVELNTFVLGDAQQPYYVGEGDADFAEITGLFDPTEDKIQLFGKPEDYDIRRTTVGTKTGEGIFYKDDLIGLVTTADTNLSLSSEAFVFARSIQGNDKIIGTAQADIADAGPGNDRVEGEAGNDILFGGIGNDNVSGGFGDDTLVGTDANVPGETKGNAGRGQIDILEGGAGNDGFILGLQQDKDGSNEDLPGLVLYDDGNNATAGLSDFAVIVDFETGADSVVLVGAPENFVVSASPITDFKGDALFLDTNLNQRFDASDELIAIFQGIKNLESTLQEKNGVFFLDDLVIEDPGDPSPPERIIGSDQNNLLNGNGKANEMFGLGGNDTLNGKSDDDTLRGAGNPNRLNDVGKGEIDRLNSGTGDDTFVLHTNNGLTVLYDDGRARNNGKKDFAIIADFDRAEDTVEVAGSRRDYLIDRSPVKRIADGQAIFHDTNSNGRLDRRRDELIAVVEGDKGFSLDDLTFIDTPINVGGNRAETLQGNGQDGIIDGRGKRDKINAKGGDDIVLGGNGNDVLNGSSGDDLLDGGKGEDSYLGKGGSDVFIIREQQGTDRILDFKDGTDRIGLAKGLDSKDLNIKQKGQDSVIRLDDETLATVKGVDASQLTSKDFVSVDYTSFEGINVPVALGLV